MRVNITLAQVKHYLDTSKKRPWLTLAPRSTVLRSPRSPIRRQALTYPKPEDKIIRSRDSLRKVKAVQARGGSGDCLSPPLYFFCLHTTSQGNHAYSLRRKERKEQRRFIHNAHGVPFSRQVCLAQLAESDQRNTSTTTKKPRLPSRLPFLVL